MSRIVAQTKQATNVRRQGGVLASTSYVLPSRPTTPYLLPYTEQLNAAILVNSCEMYTIRNARKYGKHGMGFWMDMCDRVELARRKVTLA